jgi:DHA2 family multidrug resistance protein-like MFS transporter
VHGDLRCRVRLFPIPQQPRHSFERPPERAGSASGILASARLVGQTLGAALVGLIFALTSGRPGGIGHGATLALLVGAGFAAAGAVASSLRLLGFRQAEAPPPC